MKRFRLLYLVFFFAPQILYATHLIGGELTYTCLGGNQYEIKVIIYRDCGPTNTNGTGFDTGGVVTVYNGNNGLYNELEHGIAFQEYVEDEFTDECLTIPPDLCIEKGTYSIITTLPPSLTGYQIVYQRCCRNEQVINIVDPENFGSSLVAYVPSSQDVECNSSPEFETYPPLALCLGSELEVSQSAVDADGDSLVYSFVAPLHGASPFDPVEVTAPPYSPVVWEAGYSDAYPIDSSPVVSIDSQTGEITGVPTQMGYYVVGIKVEEYRNGVYLGEIVRDFRYLIVDCEIATSSVPIADIYCEGLTVNFENESENANDFLWDFGDATTLSDVSVDAEPSYAYPDSGSYQVSLIANPNSFCSDTAVVEFSLYPDLFPWFEMPAVDCSGQAAYEFEGAGVIPPNADFLWNFGVNATPQFSTDLVPSNIQFDGGVQEISFTVSYLDCEETYEAELATAYEEVASMAVLNNEICEPASASFYVVLVDSTIDLGYIWDFGNGEVSSLQNPVVQYEEGVYDVSLLVEDLATGCDYLLEEEAWVSVYSQPEALFETTITDNCAPMVLNFENLSSNANAYTWFVNGVDVGTGQDLNYTFLEGEHDVLLQASGEPDCATDDSYAMTVEVLPEVEANFNLVYACNENLEIQIDNNSNEAITYSWSFGDGTTANNDVDAYTYFSEGVYQVQLIATNPESCNLSDSSVESITVVSPPQVFFEIETDDSCEQGFVQFGNYTLVSTYDNAQSWQWDFGDGITASGFEQSHTYDALGVYDVELTVQTDLGCTSSYSEAVDIGFEQFPVPQFSYEIDTCANEMVIINESQFVDDFFWSFDGGLVSYEENPNLSLQVGDEFYVTLIVENEYCSDTLSSYIGYSVGEIYQDIAIPNVFTPNGDLVNDEMLISGVRDCESVVFRVYNRWGKEVYYSLNPTREPWNGLHHSEEVLEGVYFYVLELDYHKITGTVTILR